MFSSLILKTIRLKNPHFQLDDSVPPSLLLQLAFKKIRQQLRACRLLWRGRFPGYLFLGKGVRFFHLANIRFGKWVQLEKDVYVSGLCRGPVRFGNRVRIGAYSQVVGSTSFDQIGLGIEIGENVGIGEFAYLGGGGGLYIGANCIIGQYFSCHPENHVFVDPEQLIRLQGVSRKGIHIGENCWIGAKVTILDGVTIGPNCVIAAGAVVTKNIPAYAVVAGVPARVIKKTKLPIPSFVNSIPA